MAGSSALMAILKIIMIDIVLSGDNAVVIAMASRTLPLPQRRKAIFWGGAGAIGLRIAATAAVAVLLVVPFLQMAGGLVLLWVAFKLLKGDGDDKEIKAGRNIWDAIGTIILADFIMSLDNMLAVGGAARGNLVFLLLGLIFSMSIMIFFSGIVANLMNRFGWLVYVGAGVLSWTAADMMLKDRWLEGIYHAGQVTELVVPAIAVAAVLGLGHWTARRAEQTAESGD